MGWGLCHLGVRSEQGAGVSKGLFDTIGMDVWLCCAIACVMPWVAMLQMTMSLLPCIDAHVYLAPVICPCLNISLFRNSAQYKMCTCEFALCLNSTMVHMSLPQKAIREPHDSEAWPSKLAACTLREGVHVYLEVNIAMGGGVPAF